MSRSNYSDSVTKYDRNMKVVKMAKDNPDLTLREIGAHFGISRQRVHQILDTYIRNYHTTASAERTGAHEA